MNELTCIFPGEEGRKLRALEQKLFEIIQAEYPEFSESTGLVHNDGRVESYAFQAFERRKVKTKFDFLSDLTT